MIHTAFRQGKRVLVLFKDASRPRVIAKFKEAKSGRLLFLDHEPIELKDVRSATIYVQEENTHDH